MRANGASQIQHGVEAAGVSSLKIQSPSTLRWRLRVEPGADQSLRKHDKARYLTWPHGQSPLPRGRRPPPLCWRAWAAARQLPDRRPISIATKATLFMGQDTRRREGKARAAGRWLLSPWPIICSYSKSRLRAILFAVAGHSGASIIKYVEYQIHNSRC
jgi:hypothetical protein